MRSAMLTFTVRSPPLMMPVASLKILSDGSFACISTTTPSFVRRIVLMAGRDLAGQGVCGPDVHQGITEGEPVLSVVLLRVLVEGVGVLLVAGQNHLHHVRDVACRQGDKLPVDKFAQFVRVVHGRVGRFPLQFPHPGANLNSLQQPRSLTVTGFFAISGLDGGLGSVSLEVRRVMLAEPLFHCAQGARHPNHLRSVI